MSRTRPLLLAVLCAAACLLGGVAGRAEPGPLPPFTLRGVALEGKSLSFAPRGQLERPAVIRVDGLVANPLGRYYLYYSAHNHAGIGLAYADSLDGPWREHPDNPLIRDVAIPDVLWIEESGRLHLWAHGDNSRTDLWTSSDGVRFRRQGTSIRADAVNTRNATYTRAYDHPLQRFGSRYVMLYSGWSERRGLRAIWLATSTDGSTWTQLPTPLVESAEGETRNIYDPALLRVGGRAFVVYQDQSAHRGGAIRYVEVDPELHPIGGGGRRFVLLEPDPGQPLQGRFRGTTFHQDGDRIVLLSGAASRPGIIVYATADLTTVAPPPRAGDPP
ncbi:hypothetical protein [Cyanobium sp. CH-040]|uniref:hypothetical protein n=1 Tax=Cyanobium sp. CH-040 TaxID=2823708 RepID=UPI0020CBC13C|nr:hypothetical protein [Cyanobium sp. CH-040]MCP9927772.1 hypothetical protein [Cyanobium sp. CH-040]